MQNSIVGEVYSYHNRPGLSAHTIGIPKRNEKMAKLVADINGYKYRGTITLEQLKQNNSYRKNIFIVPDETVVLSRSKAVSQGYLPLELIQTQNNFLPEDIETKHANKTPLFFGGIVPYEIFRTKIIVHPRVTEDGTKPKGWSDELADSLSPYVLPGYSVFDKKSADKAIKLLLSDGSVRMKNPLGSLGIGQLSVNNVEEYEEGLKIFIDEFEKKEVKFSDIGLVFEKELLNPWSLSISQQLLGEQLTSAISLQNFTKVGDKRIYSGVDKIIVRGGYSKLLDLPLPQLASKAVKQCMKFEKILRIIDGIYVTRSAYNVLHGYTSNSQFYSGVTEQTWRVGLGALLELAAKKIFSQNPKLLILYGSALHEYYSNSKDYHNALPIPKKSIIAYDGPTSPGYFFRAYACLNNTRGNELLTDNQTIKKILTP